MGTRLGQDEVICLGLNGETCCARVGYNLEKREHGLFAVHFTADRLIFAKDKNKKNTKKHTKKQTTTTVALRLVAHVAECGSTKITQQALKSSKLDTTEEGDYTGLRTVRVKA